MRRVTINQRDQSLAQFDNQNSISLQQIPSLQKKKTTKIDTNKNFSSIFIYENTIYLGTRDSKLYIYKISLENVGKSQNDQISLIQQTIITTHCQIISLIRANNTYFVTIPESDQDSFISVWQTKSKKFFTALKGHKSQISQIVFMKNNKYIVSSSWDSTVRLWCLQSLQKQQTQTIFRGTYPILDIKQFNDEILVFGGDDCFLTFWNWKKQQIIKKQFGHAGSVTFLEVSNSNVFTAGGDNKFKIWQVSKVQNNQSKEQNEQAEFQSKYQIKKIQQYKLQYDPIVYGKFVQHDMVVMDRLGEMFLYTSNKKVHRLSNHFQYNQNISNIEIFEGYLLVTTSKGDLKYFDLKSEREKWLQSLQKEKKEEAQSFEIKIATKEHNEEQKTN